MLKQERLRAYASRPAALLRTSDRSVEAWRCEPEPASFIITPGCPTSARQGHLFTVLMERHCQGSCCPPLCYLVCATSHSLLSFMRPSMPSPWGSLLGRVAPSLLLAPIMVFLYVALPTLNYIHAQAPHGEAVVWVSGLGVDDDWQQARRQSACLWCGYTYSLDDVWNLLSPLRMKTKPFILYFILIYS